MLPNTLFKVNKPFIIDKDECLRLVEFKPQINVISVEREK